MGIELQLNFLSHLPSYVSSGKRLQELNPATHVEVPDQVSASSWLWHFQEQTSKREVFVYIALPLSLRVCQLKVKFEKELL